MVRLLWLFDTFNKYELLYFIMRLIRAKNILIVISSILSLISGEQAHCLAFAVGLRNDSVSKHML